MRRLERVQLCPEAVDGCREDWRRLTEISECPAETTQLNYLSAEATRQGQGLGKVLNVNIELH